MQYSIVIQNIFLLNFSRKMFVSHLNSKFYWEFLPSVISDPDIYVENHVLTLSTDTLHFFKDIT